MTSLQTLLDEREIVRGLARFARIADAKSFDELDGVFAQDLTFDYGSGKVQSGIAALRALMSRHLERCGGTQHLVGSITVDIDGDSAVSRAYVQARHQRVGDFVGPVFDSNGEYSDQWERRSEGWRIVHRDVTWAANTGDPTILAGGGRTRLSVTAAEHATRLRPNRVGESHTQRHDTRPMATTSGSRRNRRRHKGVAAAVRMEADVCAVSGIPGTRGAGGIR
ncbi:nuclear transport factor 2 family protein [Mycobacterium sp.]|uniref:nuclear transport factor 2 family protein n=1 Tax=Mycobacterium sp. TaxID=1785 RepID=UPI003F954267